MSLSKLKTSQSHNLSAEDLAGLKAAQTGDVQVPQVTASGEEKGYKIAKHEAHLVHARIITPQFNAVTGADESSKLLQKFGALEFNKMKGEQAFAGNKVVILHDGSAGTDEEVTGSEAADSLTPQIVSSPGAGIDLTKDYSTAKNAELKETYKKLFPDAERVPASNAELLSEITGRLTFLNDEKKREELEQIEQNRLNATTDRDLTAGA
jgi:hypothetical protein